MIGLLTALPKTPLYERLKKEGRLISDAGHADNTKLATNIVPKRMSYAEMVSGYHALYRRLLDYRNIADRIRKKFRYLTEPVDAPLYSWGERFRILWRLWVHGLGRGRSSAVFHFFRSLPYFRSKLIPLVIQDWIVGLSMRDYVERHFVQQPETTNSMIRDYLASLEAAFQRYVQRGAMELSLGQVKNTAANLSITMKGWLDRNFFVQAARHLEEILENTSSSITLHIREFHEEQLLHMNHFLRQLSRYGDRIRIIADENTRKMVWIDSSVFHLVLNAG